MDGPLWLVTLERASCWSHGDGGGSWSPLMRNEAKEAGVAGRPPAEILRVKVPHACPKRDSCRECRVQSGVVRDLCCVHGLPLAWPAVLPALWRPGCSLLLLSEMPRASLMHSGLCEHSAAP